MRRTVAAIAVVSALTLVSTVLAVAPAQASSSQFVQLINDARAANGVAPLAVHDQLSGSAQGWSQQMANSGSLAHDPGISGSVSGWTRLGENVGTGPSVAQVWEMLMASSIHRTNILDPGFTHVGIGFVVDARGQIWVTQRFAAFGGAAPSPPPAVAPAPAPAPAPTPAPAPAPTPRPRAGGNTTTTVGQGDGGSGAGSDGGAGGGSAPPSAGRVAIVLDALHALGT